MKIEKIKPLEKSGSYGREKKKPVLKQVPRKPKNPFPSFEELLDEKIKKIE